MFQLHLIAISFWNLLKHNHTLKKKSKKKKTSSRVMLFPPNEVLLTLYFSPQSNSGNAHFRREIQLLKTFIYLQLSNSDRGLKSWLIEQLQAGTRRRLSKGEAGQGAPLPPDLPRGKEKAKSIFSTSLSLIYINPTTVAVWVISLLCFPHEKQKSAVSLVFRENLLED